MHSTFPSTPLCIAVLAGGDSAERTVSLRSGAAVAKALSAAGHRSIALDPAGRRLSDVDWTIIDVCFIALHGGAGEDGRVQQQLEDLGVHYTGSNPAASRLAMSKSASKRRFVESGVPTLKWAVIDARDATIDRPDRVAPLGYPLVLKPDAQGSSLGVSVADCPASLAHAVETAGAFDGLVIAEPFLLGREFTVAVLEGRALPILEIVTPESVFSFEAKYASSLTKYRFDFELPAGTREHMARTSVAAARALGAGGLVRVDLMLGLDGRAWVLEVNTIPGMTPRSLAPLAASRVGLSMASLCDTLVRRCLQPAEVA